MGRNQEAEEVQFRKGRIEATGGDSKAEGGSDDTQKGGEEKIKEGGQERPKSTGGRRIKIA